MEGQGTEGGRGSMQTTVGSDPGTGGGEEVEGLGRNCLSLQL